MRILCDDGCLLGKGFLDVYNYSLLMERRLILPKQRLSRARARHTASSSRGCIVDSSPSTLKIWLLHCFHGASDPRHPHLFNKIVSRYRTEKKNPSI